MKYIPCTIEEEKIMLKAIGVNSFKELVDIVPDNIKLNEKYGISCQLYHEKPAAGKPTEPAIIEKIAKECDFAIVAIGS